MPLMTNGNVTSLVEELARLTDAVKRLGALDQQPTTEPQSSIEIARNSKGQAQWTVKCDAHDAVGASELAQALYDDLAARYGQQAETSV
jgi:hypothetical protein